MSDCILCSFCHKNHRDTQRIISSPASYGSLVYICEECVAWCAAILSEQGDYMPSLAQATMGGSIVDLLNTIVWPVSAGLAKRVPREWYQYESGPNAPRPKD